MLSLLYLNNKRLVLNKYGIPFDHVDNSEIRWR